MVVRIHRRNLPDLQGRAHLRLSVRGAWRAVAHIALARQQSVQKGRSIATFAPLVSTVVEPTLLFLGPSQLSICTHPDKLIGVSEAGRRRGEVLFTRISKARDQIVKEMKKRQMKEWLCFQGELEQAIMFFLGDIFGALAGERKTSSQSFRSSNIFVVPYPF
jgi:hypothetical protein